ncbi:MAG TPA: PQQ-dependent sugar dehydrogenase [Saprospiraceae bacterium]|nr:PQQ-dependent sugar dehydrogenase [Saprospiraceae bacterium]HMP25139.1 PQQ-dependent sugar dehydrogenase [Saprospiraceae bacterium]
MTRLLIALFTTLIINNLYAQPDLRLEEFATGFNRPVSISNAGDERLFVVEKRGVIRILNSDGQAQTKPFLDIITRVRSAESERGLLGLAFHPQYKDNGWFFVNYTTNNGGRTRISRFRVNANNPDEADPNSEQILLEIEQPFSNHNAGDIAFGPDGYLYIPTGDGGSGGDPGNRSQNRQSLLGKMLRIDVDNGTPYAIPEDNPFVNDATTRDEIWAIGLRNPWRFSFDRLTGDMWIADVGQNSWEEINIQPANSKGGENYGWRCYEGNATFNTAGCAPPENFTFPVLVYPNQGPNGMGCSVTGGYVYRGSRYPAFAGRYFYADYCSGRVWSLRPEGEDSWINTEWLNAGTFDFVAFGEDHTGELYLAGLNSGKIFRLTDANIATATSETLPVKKLVIAPNPTDNSIRIEMEVEKPGLYQLRLFDAYGRILRNTEERIGPRKLVHEISLGGFPAGTYYLQIQHGPKTLIRKVQKN